MKYHEEVIKLIKSMSGQANILTIPRIFIDLCEGDINTALVLNQCIYWSDRTNRKDGAFYKTADEWTQETGLSKYQLTRSCKTLERLGFLITEVHRANGLPTLHFYIQSEAFTTALFKFLEIRETQNSRNSKIKKLDSLSEETAKTIESEETAKTLTETTINYTETTLPDSLDTKEFRETWEAWIAYRKEIKHKLTSSTVKRQLTKLSGYPVATAIAMIDQSIERGWTGLFEIKEDGKTTALAGISFDNGEG